MRIAELCPHSNWSLSIVADDGRVGSFDVSPYLEYEAFEDLRDPGEFGGFVVKVGYPLNGYSWRKALGRSGTSE